MTPYTLGFVLDAVKLLLVLKTLVWLVGKSCSLSLKSLEWKIFKFLQCFGEKIASTSSNWDPLIYTKEKGSTFLCVTFYTKYGQNIWLIVVLSRWRYMKMTKGPFMTLGFYDNMIYIYIYIYMWYIYIYIYTLLTTMTLGFYPASSKASLRHSAISTS